VIDHGAEVPYRNLRMHNGPVLSGWLTHLRWACGPFVAADVHQVHVISALGNVVHPGEPGELEVECCLRGIVGAVDEEHDPVGGESRHRFGPLVADVKLDPGIERRDMIALSHQLHGLRGRGRRKE